ncbi:MAG: phosphate signaling complex protein PhoU [Phycisphaeraceae bacterium]
MSVHLHYQIDKLQKLLLNVGTMVEEALNNVIRAISTRDANLARSVIEGDRHIDLNEIEVEEECLATLALHQPVAHDLRFVVAVLKINRDLERIGDLASDVAEEFLALAHDDSVHVESFGIDIMATDARTMLKQSLDALVNVDASLAQAVRRADDKVDELHRQIYEKIEKRLIADPTRAASLIRVLTMARQVERLADHAVNIAKDVIYLVQGRIVRHQSARAAAKAATEQTASAHGQGGEPGRV